MCKRYFVSVIAVLLGLIISAGGSASALSGSQFKAGRIIDDAVFFNGNAMTASQIQSFLNAKVPTCDTDGSEIYSGSTTRAEYAESRGVSPPFTCLKAYQQDTPERASESGLCGDISAQDNRTAARIIDDVARACGVSQKVLLVLLQKEQSLVTDDWPWPIQYRSATGYGCPDTAPCDEEYYGFFNQVYNAARQFKRYAADPSYFNHRAARVNAIRFNPRSSCGSSDVYIQNQATAGLYNYTPYQPNEAALDNLYGSGDSCSAYGNRNFWRMYNDWFGSTYSNVQDKAIVGDFGSTGADEIGLKRGSTYIYDLDNDSTVNKTFSIGNDTDRVLIGDWDNDGKDEVGLKRENQYFFDIDNDGASEMNFGIGKASDKPLIGDWDGDGDDNIGLKRGNYYYLDTDSDNSADIVFGIGKTTDAVITGDWDGDGDDNIGLKRGNYYYLDTDNDRSADITVGLGRVTDHVITGDWDGDGDDNIGLKRDSTYFLDEDNSSDSDTIFALGRSTDQPLVLDWNNDGAHDIVLKRYNEYYFTNNSAEVEHSMILGYY